MERLLSPTGLRLDEFYEEFFEDVEDEDTLCVWRVSFDHFRYKVEALGYEVEEAAPMSETCTADMTFRVVGYDSVFGQVLSAVMTWEDKGDLGWGIVTPVTRLLARKVRTQLTVEELEVAMGFLPGWSEDDADLDSLIDMARKVCASSLTIKPLS